MHQNGDVNYTYLFAGLDYFSFHTAGINDQPAIVTKLVNALCIVITLTIHSETIAYIAPTHIQTYHSSTKEYACFQANACQEYRHLLLLTDIYPRDTFYTTLGELRTMGKKIDLSLMEGKVFTIEGTSECPKKNNHFTVLNESKDGIKRWNKKEVHGIGD